MKKWLESLLQDRLQPTSKPQDSSSTDKEKSHTIDKTNTHWVFISAHSEEIDLQDVLWCAQQLILLGVPANKILIYTDHDQAAVHFQHLLTGVYVGDLDQIDSHYPTAVNSDHVIAIVAGHGGHMGIKTFSGKVFKPVPLLNLIKSPAGVQTVSLILGQCYAGVFNYLNVRGKPKVCIMGATNLHLSLANLTTAEFVLPNGKKVDLEWIANIFLLRFFFWLQQRVDVDGDGVISLLDGYRRAAILSNDELREIKSRNKAKIDELEIEKTKLTAILTTDPSAQARLAGIQGDLEMLNSTLTHQQEPWVLHADQARNLVVNL